MEGIDRGDKREQSPFEAQVQAIIRGLEANFKPRFGSNLTQAKQALLHIRGLSKLQLEGFYGSVMIISFNDADYARIQAKVNDLLQEIERCLSEHGIE